MGRAGAGKRGMVIRERRLRGIREACRVACVLALLASALFAGCGTGVRVPEGYSLTPEMEELLSRYPAPGRLIDVGGYSLHLVSTGKGEPTVVMEAGGGSFSLVWSQVAPEVAKNSRVVTYDRAGLGWSDPSPKARTADNILTEFRAMLEKAGVKPPYVLVGHSVGAIYMRMYAHKYPREVVGMVLVDPQDEELPVAAGAEVSADIDRAAEAAASFNRQRERKCAEGMYATKLSSVPLDNQLPEEAAKQRQALQACEPWLYDTMADEELATTTSWAQARELGITGVGDIPLVVLVSDQTVDLSFSIAQNQEANTVWRELQIGQVSESPQGELVIAPGSGHFIQLDQPDLVIKSINKVLRLAT